MILEDLEIFNNEQVVAFTRDFMKHYFSDYSLVYIGIVDDNASRFVTIMRTVTTLNEGVRQFKTLALSLNLLISLQNTSF